MLTCWLLLPGCAADLVQSEVRLLLARLQGWDVAGEGRASLDEVYQVGCVLQLQHKSERMSWVL